MTQYGYPTSDITAGSWTDVGGPTSHWDCLNEASYSDSDYIQLNNATANTCEVRLNTLTDPSSSINHIVHLRVQKAGSGTINCTCYLVENTTVLVTQALTLTTGWVDVSFTLTGAQADSITDYTNLRLRFTGTAGSSSRYVRVSWANLGIPSVAVADSTSKSAYIKGSIPATPTSKSVFTRGSTIATPTSKSAYLKGGTIATPTQKSAYTKGRADATPSSKSVYVKGSTIATPSNKSAYLRGGIVVTPSSKSAYLRSVGYGINNKSVYTRGSVITVPTGIHSYLKGSALTVNNTTVFLIGGILINNNIHAYTEGYSTGGDVVDNQNAFTIGIANNLIPDGDVNKVGVWKNELEQTTNLYQSVDETIADDSDYVYNIDPTNMDYIEFSLTSPSGNPGSGDVVVFVRGKSKTNIPATIELRQGVSTVIATRLSIPFFTIPQTYYLQLTPIEKANITDWTDLRIRIYIDMS